MRLLLRNTYTAPQVTLVELRPSETVLTFCKVTVMGTGPSSGSTGFFVPPYGCGSYTDCSATGTECVVVGS